LAAELYLITDWSCGDDPLLERVERALQAGPGISVQHRNPAVSTAVFFAQAQKLARVCRRYDAPLFINRRLDVALALEAHLHLPSYGLWPSDVLGRIERISVSVHSEEEAKRCTGATLALVSPVIAKENVTALGLEGFLRLETRCPCPAFALGGIKKPLPGIHRHAVISAVLHADDPKSAAEEFLRAS
jgi:thiamine-phosphate pyrophosphorylase